MLSNCEDYDRLQGKVLGIYEAMMVKLWVVKWLALLSVGFVSVLHSSTAEEWQKYRQQVQTACIQQSDLLAAELVGDLISYDDQVGFDAWVITGQWPQQHMDKQSAQQLCLYDRHNQQAYIAIME